MLTTSSWWSTLIPFSRSVLTISKWPSAAARWRAVCPVCNKQSKREIKFHETRRKKNIHNTTKKNSNRSFWGTQTCPKNAQQRWFLHNICSHFFFFSFMFLYLFFCPLSQQHYSRLLGQWPQLRSFKYSIYYLGRL